jgi:hypothetical protein
MTDQATIRMVIGGLVAMGLASLVVYSLRPSEASFGAVTATIGALASMLARTSTKADSARDKGE